MVSTPPVCWVLSDGKAGHENQSLGLAEALSCRTRVIRLAARWPWRSLPPILWLDPLNAVGYGDGRLEPPWPDLVIGTGRLSAPVAAAVRRASAGSAFAVQILDAKLPATRFDLMIVPAHDSLRGENVVPVQGSLHRITAERLNAAAPAAQSRYGALATPRVAVLIGGSSGAYRMTEDHGAQLAAQLAELTRSHGAGVLVTMSRRTPRDAAQALRAGLSGVGAEIWDGQGDNPYLDFLSLADHVVVTCDSVSMISEAASTGKPVSIVALDGGSPKFTRFHRAMEDAGITRPFDGRLETWSYPPLRETQRVAALIRQRLDGHGQGIIESPRP